MPLEHDLLLLVKQLMDTSMVMFNDESLGVTVVCEVHIQLGELDQSN